MDNRSDAFVARRSELARWRRACDDPTSTGILFLGEAGVGKTRLLTELLSIATRKGLKVVRVTGHEAARRIPLGVMVRVMDSRPNFADDGSLLWWTRTTLLNNVGDGRFVFILDDAHLIDQLTGALVHDLASEGRALVLAAARPREQRPAALDALWREGGLDHLELLPLTPENERKLAENLLGGALEEQTWLEIHRLTAGNPLWLRELIRSAVEGGSLKANPRWQSETKLEIGNGLHDVLTDRLGRLSKTQRQGLGCLTVSENLPFAAMAALVPLPEIADLERRGLITIAGDTDSREVRWSHQRLQEVAAHALPIAEALQAKEAVVGVLAEQELDERSTLLAARLQLDTGLTSVVLQLAAAETLLRHMDPHSALEHARSARQQHDSFEIALIECRALVGAGDPSAISTLNDLETRASSDAQILAVARLTVEQVARFSNDPLSAMGILEKVRQQVDDPTAESLLYFDFLTNLSVAVAAQDLTQMLSLAPLTPDMPLLVRIGARGFEAMTNALVGQSKEATAAADQAIELLEGLEIVPNEWWYPHAVTAFGITMAHHSAGDIGRGLAISGQFFETLNEDVSPEQWAATSAGIPQMSCFAGDATELQSIANAIDIVDAIGAVHYSMIFRTFGLWKSALARGKYGEVWAAQLDAAPAYLKLNTGRAEAVARVAQVASTGAIDAAADLARRLFDEHHEAALFSAWLAHDLARLGRPEEACELLEGLRRPGDPWLADQLLLGAEAVLSRDAELLESAAINFRNRGYVLFSAEAETLAAKHHRRVEAVRRATARATSDRASIGNPWTPILADLDHDPLTPRQREIAYAVAHGNTNKDIAAQLGISVRTVENQLYRVYRSLGLGGREELVEWVNSGLRRDE